MSIYTRMKKGMKETVYEGSYSDYWLPRQSIRRSFFDSDRQLRSAGFADLDEVIKMSSVQKAVANFVRILTGRPIPVRFYTGEGGKTDGERITISGNTANLDSIVGLALHEASHCMLTDFKMMEHIMLGNRIPMKDYEQALKLGIGRDTLIAMFQKYFNWVEDRRIDNYIYTMAPGYRGYYHALYQRYFNNDVMSKGLLSEDYRTETPASYKFRIYNLTNPATDLDALRGLRRIASIVNLPRINRLADSNAAATVALEIVEVILECCEMPPPKKTKSKSNDQKKDKKQSPKVKSDEQSDQDEQESDAPSEDGANEPDPSADEDEQTDGEPEQSDPTDEDDTEEPEDDTDTPNDSKMDDVEEEPSDEVGGEVSDDSLEDLLDEVTKGDGKLKPSDEKKIEKQLDEQEKFLNGDIEKEKVDEQVSQQIDTVSRSGSSIVNVEYGDHKIPVTTIRVVSDELMQSEAFEFSSWGRSWVTDRINGPLANDVQEGIILGNLLGRKLQIRNEEKQTKYSRKETGRIDRKLLAELGFNNTSVFSRMAVEKFDKAFIHLTIDVSGSMSGGKINKAVKTAVAIAKFASMTQNIDVQISIRAAIKLPIVAIMYDSRKDKFSKVARQFQWLSPAGCTPEGLTFSAISKEIPNPTDDLKVYFINFSDGEPGFTLDNIETEKPKAIVTSRRRRTETKPDRSYEYSGDMACMQTRGEITKLMQRGVRILSYFISKNVNQNGYYVEAFKRMYGAAASFVDAQELPQLAKTLEEMFSQKG